MEKLQVIINSLPQLLNYFVPGFVLTVCFRFVTYSKRSESDNHIFLSSVVCSYLMYLATKMVAEKVEYVPRSYVGILLVEAIFMGIVFGFLWRSNFVHYVLSKVFARNITESPFVETWRSISEELVWFVDLYLKEPEQIVRGQVVDVYDPYGSPVLKIMCFAIYDKNWSLLEDEINSKTSSLLIKLSNVNYYIESIEEREQLQ